MSNPQRPSPAARAHSSDSRRSDRPREAAPRDSYTTSSRPPTTGYAQQQQQYLQQQQPQQYAQSAYYPPDPSGRRSLRYSNAVLPSQAYPYAAAQQQAQQAQQQYHMPSAHQQPVGSPTLAAPTTPEMGNGDWGHSTCLSRPSVERRG